MSKGEAEMFVFNNAQCVLSDAVGLHNVACIYFWMYLISIHTGKFP